ncbi:MAG: PEGA domain-containing protein, partial [Chitinivibrionales bacterium]|nr:PEGA domain-containing protein [Chitinivibrionales bacterium]
MQCKGSHFLGYAVLLFLVSAVSADDSLSLTGAAPVATGNTIMIQSTPDNAVVFLDGDSVGVTPLERSNVSVGSHSLRLVKDGFVTLEEMIFVESISSTPFQYTLNAAQPDNIAQSEDVTQSEVGQTPEPETAEVAQASAPVVTRKPRARRAQPNLALTHSVLVPGLGQLQYKEKVKGYTFMGLAAAGLGGILLSYRDYHAKDTAAQ